MKVPELVGTVAAAIVREELTADPTGGAPGTLRFVLNLGPEQTAAAAQAILADGFLRERIDIKLPAQQLAGFDLPAETLTTLPATYFRNATCAKAGFLLAEIEHGEEASFHEVAQLGPTELLDRIDLWVRAAATDLHLSQEHLRWWERALTGLRDLRLVSLDRFATYVLRTRDGVETDGQPLLHALGAALPSLRLPRDSSYFNGIREKSRTAASVWRQQFAAAQRRRGALLLKQTPSQVVLSEEELRVAFDKVREVIPESRHPVVSAFISSPSGWNPQAAALAECEWEEIKPLFDGLQREKLNLGQETLAFYDERELGLLSDDDREYLKLLVGRRTTEATDEDVTFYESRRNELKEDRKLKSAWDRFVFGKPIETADLLAGLATALEPLFNRAPLGVRRRLRIRCDRATKRDLRELNVDAGLYFAHRYAGLRRLLGSRVSWDVGDLFQFADVVERWRSSGKPLNRSVARAALQLKFVLELDTEIDSGGVQTVSAQVVWRYVPNGVACQFADDWNRLTQHPLILCRAAREVSGTKTRARTVDLADVKTFVPAYDRDRGSFVPVYKPDKDLARQWRANLKTCLEQRFLSEATTVALEKRFTAFERAYSAAIREFAQHGAAGADNCTQVREYAELLDAITTLAKGDRNRDFLLKPLLQVGVVPVDGGAAAAIVAPWHPFRLAAMWRKARLVAELTDRLLNADEVFFGDTRLFFRDLSSDLHHPLYPEIVPIWTDDGPQLLSVSDSSGDYSLHEPPVVSPDGGDDTNESPIEGSECVLDLVRRYLALHPHERANMSVVLFNCDSARLPQAVVDRIGTLHDDDEDVRCQVLLRHVDAERLRDVYRGILGADSSADAYSASEATQDFMALAVIRFSGRLP